METSVHAAETTESADFAAGIDLEERGMPMDARTQTQRRLSAVAPPRTRGGTRVEITLGDLSRAKSDVVVSSVCPTLTTGGEVSRALARAAGTIVERQLARAAAERFPSGLPVGGSVATSAGDLDAQWVVHAAGPMWTDAPSAIAELSATYVNALRLADELGAKTVAFPALCVGGCRFPVETAAATALAAVRAADCDVERVRFVLSNRLVYATFVAAFVG